MGLGMVLLIPFGVIHAVSGMSITLNVISELVGGFVVPGKAIAMNMFKSYGCMVLLSAMQFSRDLKLGHYAKVPPRSMFRAQLVATIIGCLTVRLFSNAPNIITGSGHHELANRQH
jgi:OPT oligopeptide transporter protein